MKKLSVENRKKAAVVAIIVLFAIAMLVVYARIGKPMTEGLSDINRLRSWVEERGWTSRLIYAIAICFQVIVAVIPGEPFEMAAGFVFGPVEGTLICLAGISLGSMIIFGLVRLFGMKLVEVFFSREKVESLKILRNPRKLFLGMTVLIERDAYNFRTVSQNQTEKPAGTGIIIHISASSGIITK